MRRRGARVAGRRAARRTMRRQYRRRRRRMRRRVIGGMVLIGGAAAIYKLSKNDAQRIEEYTGVPPEEMEDEDLRAAMDDLGIQNQPISEAEKAELMAGEDQSNPTTASAGPVPSAAAQEDYIAELEKLASLRDRGIITDEDFETKKKQLLGL